MTPDLPAARVRGPAPRAVRALLALLATLTAAPLAAQPATPPRPATDLAAEYRARLAASGLSAEQLRSRLRAEGFPDTLLDGFLPRAAAAARGTPTDTALAALQALGFVSRIEADSVRRDGRERRFREQARRRLLLDSAALDPDTLVAMLDSLRGDYAPRRGAEPDTGDVTFGLALFARATTQFDPNLLGPVDASYRLGPGDQLTLVLTGEVESTYQLPVARDGSVVIPGVGQLFVNALTIAQLEKVLYDRLRRVYSGIGDGPESLTQFAVTVSRLRSHQVFVVGDVASPGSYRVSGAATVLTALYAAGGPSANGSLRAVEVRRAGKTVGTLDVYDYLLKGDASRDLRLENGDVVFVPVHGARVRVAGEVLRPATYELKAGETLRDLVRAAGGFTARAGRRRAQIERIVPPTERGATGGADRVVLEVGADQFSATEAPALRLEAGDVVRIFPVADRVRRRITVVGNVWTPGSQGLRDGGTLADAIRLAGGIRPDTYLGTVLVTRTTPDGRRTQLRAQFADTTGRLVQDLALQEDDEVRVFATSEFRAERTVSIGGAVRKPGRFPWREGMTLRDLVLLAGGVEESALLTEAEVARLPADRGNGTTAVTQRVPLDSTYLFERGADGRYVGPPGVPAPAARAPEVPLSPYDAVLILRQPDWELQRTVYVGGEVRFPGRYALVRKTERLTELLSRAGGLTAEAYAEGVEFVRTRDRTGRIGVDLPRAQRDPASRENLVLAAGDSIVVPAYSPVVTVAGAVNSPTAVPWVPGASIDYYVRAAGGERSDADHGRIFVRQPNGRVESVRRRPLFFDAVPEPRAGSVVTVAVRDPRQPRDWVPLAGLAAQILGAIVTIVVVSRNTR